MSKSRCLLWCLVVLGGLVSVRASAAEVDSARSHFFEAKIRPQLVQHCYECHSAGAKKVRGGLLLDTRAGLRQGGDSGPAVLPGKPAESLLVRALQHDSLKMPPRGKLSAAVIADFVRWVQEGAFDPRSTVRDTPPPAPAPAKKLWSLRPIVSAPVPAVQQDDWPRSDIDRFLLARLEASGIAPAPDAEPHVVLRRLHHVLTGLPPTPEQVTAFAASAQKNRTVATEKVIDSLLASPHFGERWARHWLDLARYTDVSGSTAPVAYPQAWRYRQYVIDSFNADKPFDRFVREQLAGDLLPARTAEEKASNLIATGYLALFHIVAADRDPEKRKLDVIDDQLDVLGKNFLGISLGCARCHDHKLDPITTHDYHALAGILRSTTNVKGGFGSSEPEAVLLPPVGPAAPFWMQGDRVKVLAVQEDRSPQDVAIRIRGDVDNKGPVVPRGLPGLGPLAPVPRIPAGQSGRRQLTDWLLHRDNPLVARVLVNRIWHHVFGQGLVRSTDNFGTTGELPSHPELLDYLAVRFREHHRWSFQSFLRELLLTRAWQLSARADAHLLARDPDNRLLGRAQRRRQDAEALLDALSFVAGQLDLTPAAQTVPKFGSGNQASTINLPIPEETLRKRALYWPVFRKDVPAILDPLTLFDRPLASAPCGNRPSSIVPAQSLFLLNSPLVQTRADALATRLLTDDSLPDDAARVARLHLLLFARPASDAERARALAFLVNGTARTGPERAADRAVWSQLCHTLLISNEFLVVE